MYAEEQDGPDARALDAAQTAEQHTHRQKHRHLRGVLHKAAKDGGLKSASTQANCSANTKETSLHPMHDPGLSQPQLQTALRTQAQPGFQTAAHTQMLKVSQALLLSAVCGGSCSEGHSTAFSPPFRSAKAGVQRKTVRARKAEPQSINAAVCKAQGNEHFNCTVTQGQCQLYEAR
jgi:hypothetical protein